jgi:hypothetical protein
MGQLSGPSQDGEESLAQAGLSFLGLSFFGSFIMA